MMARAFQLTEIQCTIFTPNFRNIQQIRQTAPKSLKFAGQTAVSRFMVNQLLTRAA
jgi:hypothetical protein